MRIRYFVAGSLLHRRHGRDRPGPAGFRGGFGGGGPHRLISNKAVQEDLKLTEEQVTKLKEWGQEFRTKSSEIMKDKGIDFKDFKSFQTDEARKSSPRRTPRSVRKPTSNSATSSRRTRSTA